MPIVVEALDEEAYSAWAAEKLASMNKDSMSLAAVEAGTDVVADASETVKAAEKDSENN